MEKTSAGIILPGSDKETIITPSRDILLPQGTKSAEDGHLARIDLVQGGALGTETLNCLTGPSNAEMSEAGFANPKQLNELKSIFIDLLSGDPAASHDDRFSYLNFKQIKLALEWLMTNNFDERLQSLLLERPYLLTFKNKPPTPEEFLTHKYIGSMADSLWLPLRKAFVEYFDPMKPYRTAVLNPSIGVGKKVTITSPVLVGYEDYYEIEDDSGEVYCFTEDDDIWYENHYVKIKDLIGIGKLTLSKVNYINMMIYNVEKTQLFNDAFEISSYGVLIDYFKKVNNDVYKQWNLYTHKHHIIPRSEGGNDDKNNIVELPYYFHMLAHYLRGKEAEKNGDKLSAYKNYKAVCYALKENTLPKTVIDMHKKLSIVVEALEKNKNLEKEHIWATDGKTTIRIFEFELKNYPGFRRGRTFRSPATKKWMNKDGKNYYFEKTEVEQKLKEGYKLGMFQTEKMKNMPHNTRSTLGTKWMFKGDERKCVKEELVNEYLSKGWKLGHNYRSSYKAGSKKAIHKDHKILYVDLEKLQSYLDDGWKIGSGYNGQKGKWIDEDN